MCPRRLRCSAARAPGVLHAKVLVFDRRDVFVGSFNFDPRSRHLNTEDGLIIHSAELARDAAELLTAFMTLRYSFQVRRAPEEAGATLAPGLEWETLDQGRLERYTREPWVGVWRRLLVELAAFFMAEDEL